MYCLWKTFWQNWWWPVILLVLLYLAMMFWPGGQWRSIEADVQAKVTSSLQTQGLNQLTVQTKDRGRDVLLNGTVLSEKQKSLAIEQAQASTDSGNRIAPRTVEWAATIKTPNKPIVFTDGSLEIDLNTHDVVLTGVLANQQQIDIAIVSAKEHFAPRNITNNLSIGKNINAFSQLTSIFSSFTIEQGSIVINNRSAKLLGTVDSAQQKQTIANNMAAALGSGYVIDNRIDIATPKPTPVPEIVLSQENLLCQNQLVGLLNTSKIFFQTSKADIKSKSIPLLNQVADILKQCPEAIIEVSGHTDNLGGEQLNLSLSQHRASTVKNYLINSGITSNNITAIGFGESKPIASNKTTQGRAQNRRIEFTIK